MIRYMVPASLLLLCPAATQAGQDPAVPPPMVVTTDTETYCAKLRTELQAHAVLPREVRELQAGGWTMCRAGQVRRGISRLRRALMILHAGPGRAEAPAQDGVDPAGPAPEP